MSGKLTVPYRNRKGKGRQYKWPQTGPDIGGWGGMTRHPPPLEVNLRTLSPYISKNKIQIEVIHIATVLTLVKLHIFTKK